MKAFRASDDASIILVEWTIADDKVTTATVEIQQGGEGSWELVERASQLKRPVSEFKVSDLKADSSYRFRVDMRRPGESAPGYVYSDTGTWYNLISVQAGPNYESFRTRVSPPLGRLETCRGEVIPALTSRLLFSHACP